MTQRPLRPLRVRLTRGAARRRAASIARKIEARPEALANFKLKVRQMEIWHAELRELILIGEGL